MSNQEGCRPSSDYDIQKSVIERIFDERKQYLIIALTGKIGAGSSYVSSFIQDDENTQGIRLLLSSLNASSEDDFLLIGIAITPSTLLEMKVRIAISSW